MARLSEMTGIRVPSMLAATTALLLLGGCEKLEGFNFLKSPDTGDEDTAAMAARSVRLVERDVEAPEVFSATEAGLWDGRPSLGGVWVAHPDVKDPERVIIRNSTNNKFVIGALFRRERTIPGPRLQLSSDAAAALGMLAGQPVELNVTALRREEVAPEPEVTGEEEFAAPSEIATASLDDPIQSAAAAIDAAEARPVEVAAAAPAQPTPRASKLAKPFIQIGIFSVEANATNTANQMRQAGMVPTVKKQMSKGKPFWRVLVGPAGTGSDRSALLAKIKKVGFTDAYAVSN